MIASDTELKKWDRVRVIGLDYDGSDGLVGFQGQVMDVNGSRIRVYFSCDYGGYSVGSQWYPIKSLRRLK